MGLPMAERYAMPDEDTLPRPSHRGRSIRVGPHC